MPNHTAGQNARQSHLSVILSHIVVASRDCPCNIRYIPQRSASGLGVMKMTIANRAATTAYLHALNDMANTKPGKLAAIADRMAGRAFNSYPDSVKPPKLDAMMDIETAMFTALCESNGVDWRLVAA
jgi:hypothetical protein